MIDKKEYIAAMSWADLLDFIIDHGGGDWVVGELGDQTYRDAAYDLWEEKDDWRLFDV